MDLFLNELRCFQTHYNPIQGCLQFMCETFKYHVFESLQNLFLVNYFLMSHVFDSQQETLFVVPGDWRNWNAVELPCLDYLGIVGILLRVDFTYVCWNGTSLVRRIFSRLGFFFLKEINIEYVVGFLESNIFVVQYKLQVLFQIQILYFLSLLCLVIDGLVEFELPLELG